MPNKISSLKSANIFDIFNQEPSVEHLPPLSEIIWGVGFKSLINCSWADDCGA